MLKNKIFLNHLFFIFIPFPATSFSTKKKKKLNGSNGGLKKIIYQLSGRSRKKKKFNVFYLILIALFSFPIYFSHCNYYYCQPFASFHLVIPFTGRFFEQALRQDRSKITQTVHLASACRCFSRDTLKPSSWCIRGWQWKPRFKFSKTKIIFLTIKYCNLQNNYNKFALLKKRRNRKQKWNDRVCTFLSLVRRIIFCWKLIFQQKILFLFVEQIVANLG